MNTINYSEIFYSPQGEGLYTGRNSLWFRFFACNLQCDGFSQKNPTNKSTYILPYKNIDISKIKKLEDIPVFENGCDSSYSWSKKFKHLTHRNSVENIVDDLENILPTGNFLHKKSHQDCHMVFSGGEPLLNQTDILNILNEFKLRNNYPKFITIETNGTQKLTDSFISFFQKHIELGYELFFSISPKLYNVSGEENKKAILPKVIYDYYKLTKKGQLKFVMNNAIESWNELDEVVAIMKDTNILYEIWCMPVGATTEAQLKIAESVFAKSSAKGYHCSARVHSYVFGNKIGY